MAKMLGNLPSVNELLESAPLKGLVDRVGRSTVAAGVRQVLDRTRQALQTAAYDSAEMASALPGVGELAERIAHWILWEREAPQRPVVNATGELLSAELGPAPLAEEALVAMAEVAGNFSSSASAPHEDSRAASVKTVERLLRDITGVEAALVVNSQAAGMLLALAGTAAGGEVLVSRGELIEVGEGSRLSDLLQLAGVRLREVGTTNKTRLSDYAEPLSEATRALLRLHASNFLLTGATEGVSLEQLAELGRERRLPVIADLGAGGVFDCSPMGIAGEPTVAAARRAGADLLIFSGGKLLGGPACGIVAGRRSLVEPLAKHPLLQVLRAEKSTLAALAATLRLYREPEEALQRIPLLQLLAAPIENLRNRANRLAPQFAAVSAIESAVPLEGTTFLGEGSLPTQQLPTVCLALTPAEGDAEQLAARLREGAPSVFGRVAEGKLLLDLRSVLPRHDLSLTAAVEALGEPRDDEPAAAEEE